MLPVSGASVKTAVPTAGVPRRDRAAIASQVSTKVVASDHNR